MWQNTALVAGAQSTSAPTSPPAGAPLTGAQQYAVSMTQQLAPLAAPLVWSLLVLVILIIYKRTIDMMLRERTVAAKVGGLFELSVAANRNAAVSPDERRSAQAAAETISRVSQTGASVGSDIGVLSARSFTQ